MLIISKVRVRTYPKTSAEETTEMASVQTLKATWMVLGLARCMPGTLDQHRHRADGDGFREAEVSDGDGDC